LTKKKRTLFRLLALPVILLAIAAIATYYLTEFLNKPKFVRYPAFGIDIPVNFSIHGIDVSHHQDNIDWKAVHDMQVQQVKIGFCFIKATEGLNDTDLKFRMNWFKAKQAGIPRGAYHFFSGRISGKAQADHFIETVQLSKGDLPPVLDIEQTNGASADEVRQRAKDWLQRIEAQYKVKPIIYTNVDFYTNFLSSDFDDYPLWVAHYLAKDKPRISRNWIFWQHNESGHVNGVDANVDFNVFNGDSLAFRKILLK
jgi:lysozyme